MTTEPHVKLAGVRMGVPVEKEIAGPEVTDSPEPSVLNIPDYGGDSEDGHNKELTEGAPEIQYPPAIKRALLASACLISVFLIALDQVRIVSIPTP